MGYRARAADVMGPAPAVVCGPAVRPCGLGRAGDADGHEIRLAWAVQGAKALVMRPANLAGKHAWVLKYQP